LSRGAGRDPLLGRMRWFLFSAVVVIVLAPACSRRPSPAAEPPAAFDEVLARGKVFRGFHGKGSIALEHKADRMTIPVEVRLSEDLVLEAHSEVSHFLLPFEGEVRLVSTDSTTFLYTNIGAYDLAMTALDQSAIRAFLLSLGGGGDWLLWWLAREDCGRARKTRCRGLEIELEPHSRLPSISRWEMREASGGASFKGQVDEYEPGGLVPRVIRGVIQPQEISVYLNYVDIFVGPMRPQ